MDTVLGYLMAAISPLVSLSGQIWAYMPGVAAALLLLLLGSLIAFWLRYLVGEVFKVVKVDDYVRRFGLSDVLNRLGLGHSLTHLIGVVAYSAVLLAFVLGAAEAVGLTIIPDYLHRVVLFSPKLIGVILVMGGGLFLGDIAGRIVHRAAEANRIRGAEALMRVTHGLLVIFSGVVALDILGISIHVFFDSMQIFLAAVGLGLAIAFGVAFGMAGRDMAERWIRDLTPRSSKGAANEHEPRMRVVR